MAFTKKPYKRLVKKYPARKVTVPKVVKAFVKKAIAKDDRIIVKDSFNLPTIVPNILLNTTNSIEISDVSPYNATVGTSSKEQRIGNDITLHKLWSKWNVSLPGGASNIMRFMLVRYPDSSSNGITSAEVLQHNGAGQAVISPLQDNVPYQVLMDKTFVMNNPDGTGAKRFVFTIAKNFKKRPLRIEYLDNSTTGLAVNVNKGLLRLYYFQADNSVGVGATILNHCTRFQFTEVGGGA